ncbi:hydrogen peroxide-inducible genes activator [Pelagibacterium lacus]|uniref:Hydrogen peroxide-inducible genes activator n=1 Tax=Pelagibacterium lacus TaxID=2282655 RepID=A0A369WDI8_9HYPH|nr:hydrogen peroxide-inducible genes activator [Pelagibacterium lacus]RDE10181.1 hydrogen peroxide-inducible genes activator [Pelagibacterium lacus]
MSAITLRQLHYARIIAEEGHFGRAAARCHVTQPALSQQVKLLEERCNSAIFDRSGKAVALTPFGREFLDYATRVLNAAAELEGFADASAGRPARPLRFALIPTVAPYLLPEILPALGIALPEIGFAVSEGKTDRLLSGLAKGDFDLALIATETTRSNLTTVPLFADPFVLATPRGADFEDPVALSDLPRDEVLLLEEGHCLRDQAVDACALKPDLQGRTFAATSLATILELVANGYGVTLLPAISLKREEQNRRIDIHTLRAPGAGRLLRLVWRAGSPYEALFRRIAAILTEVGEAALRTDLRLA